MKKIQAYLRLCTINTRKKDLESFSNTVYRSLYKKEYNDVDRAKILEIVNIRFENDMAKKKDLLQKDFLTTEKAHDMARVINLKYA